jgi:hypothetical protein
VSEKSLALPELAAKLPLPAARYGTDGHKRRKIDVIAFVRKTRPNFGEHIAVL